MNQRIRSIDILRGLIMILMAIDHVRLYGGIPAGGESASLFFTRWITHFSAPGFAFFAGTSIFLMSRKMNDFASLSKFLLKRGLLLVLLEITFIRLLWAFKIDYSQFFLAGVIWMLGWCMVIMAFFVRFNAATLGILGLCIMAGQSLFHYVPNVLPAHLGDSFSLFWNFIYPTDAQSPDNIAILYVIVPWIGVMAAGYGFGLVIEMEENRRRNFCISIGLSSTFIFVLAGSLIALTSDNPHNTPFLFRLLNQNKYPASQLFLLMTLGPLILLVPFVEKAKGWLWNTLDLLGRSPMFYYLAHVILIHVSALVVNYLRSGQFHQDWYQTAPFYTIQPEDVRWSLPMMYAVWLIDITILYFACKWYFDFKVRHPAIKWLKYI